MKLERITLSEIDERDADLLAKASKEELGGMDPKTLARTIDQGIALLWRFTGDDGERGIFVTTVTHGGELFFWMMAGEGILRHAKWIFGEFEKVAKEMGAKWMTGIAKPGLAWLYKRRLGFQTRNVQVVKEIV